MPQKYPPEFYYPSLRSGCLAVGNLLSQPHAPWLLAVGDWLLPGDLTRGGQRKPILDAGILMLHDFRAKSQKLTEYAAQGGTMRNYRTTSVFQFFLTTDRYKSTRIKPFRH